MRPHFLLDLAQFLHDLIDLHIRTAIHALPWLESFMRRQRRMALKVRHADEGHDGANDDKDERGEDGSVHGGVLLEPIF